MGAKAIIRCYQLLLAPYFGYACRFTPSCSQYAIDALEQYGLIRGVGMAIWRIVRCNPWNASGYDPVP